jgi:hypothetical protein
METALGEREGDPVCDAEDLEEEREEEREKDRE